MKALVAGGTGFIGRNLVAKLSTLKVDVVVLIRNNLQVGIKKTSMQFVDEFHYMNSEDIDALLRQQSFDYILNLATNYNSTEDSNSILKTFKANIEFADHVIGLSLNHRIPLVSFGTYLQEIQKPKENPSFYVYSKRTSYDLKLKLSKISDFNFVELILNDTYGEGDERQKFLYTILNSMNGVRMKATSGEQLINLLHVDDVCDGIVHTLKQLENRELGLNASYGIRSSRYVTLRQLATICELEFQKKSNIDWGSLKYRGNEIFSEPNLSPVIPKWTENVSLEAGVRKLITKFERSKND